MVGGDKNQGSGGRSQGYSGGADKTSGDTKGLGQTREGGEPAKSQSELRGNQTIINPEESVLPRNQERPKSSGSESGSSEDSNKLSKNKSKSKSKSSRAKRRYEGPFHVENRIERNSIKNLKRKHNSKSGSLLLPGRSGSPSVPVEASVKAAESSIKSSESIIREDNRPRFEVINEQIERRNRINAWLLNCNEEWLSSNEEWLNHKAIGSIVTIGQVISTLETHSIMVKEPNRVLPMIKFMVQPPRLGPGAPWPIFTTLGNSQVMVTNDVPILAQSYFPGSFNLAKYVYANAPHLLITVNIPEKYSLNGLTEILNRNKQDPIVQTHYGNLELHGSNSSFYAHSYEIGEFGHTMYTIDNKLCVVDYHLTNPNKILNIKLWVKSANKEKPFWLIIDSTTEKVNIQDTDWYLAESKRIEDELNTPDGLERELSIVSRDNPDIIQEHYTLIATEKIIERESLRLKIEARRRLLVYGLRDFLGLGQS